MARSKSKSLPKILSPMVKVLKSTDEATTYLALGVPYFGPDYLEGKDLQGEYFDATTDFGFVPGTRTPVIARGLSFYDHAYHPLFGTEPIGVSKFLAEVEDEGQWWEIEVRRAYRYHDFLLQLAEKGILGASSQPIQTSVKIDYDTGHIERWHTAEVSLTPTPANPLAIVEAAKSFMDDPAQLEQVQKSLTGSVIIVPAVKATFPVIADLVSKADNEEESPEKQAEEVEEAPTQVATEQHEEPTLAEQIEAAFEDEDEKVDEETPEEQRREELESIIGEEIKSIFALVTEIRRELDTIRQADEDRSRELLKQVTEVRTGLNVFATQVAKQLKIEVRSTAEREARKSTAEKEADEVVRKDAHVAPRNSPYGVRSSSVPDNAPGRY